jgi:hypothetical protein
MTRVRPPVALAVAISVPWWAAVTVTVARLVVPDRVGHQIGGELAQQE